MPTLSGPQERVLRHTVDQIVDAVSGLPILDVPVPQMVDQPMALLMAFDFLVPEQVIKVPKISTPSRCPRTVLSVPQTAEQLVEAPTIVSLIEVIRQLVEQTVGGGGGGGLPSFLPGLSYSFSVEQIVDNPVPRRGLGGGLDGLHPRQSSAAFGEADHRFQQRLPSKSLTFQFCVVRLTIFIKISFPLLVLPICRSMVFRTFPTGKKCEDPAHPGVGAGRGLQLVASMSLAGVWCCRLRH